ncbi:hypothetical protein SDC9_117701 [bioreactor metagenome]|uniref:Uncharacterized protein n=1 Tax=bioreactor metagenome TaxID=1076179 RepID=A0A645C1E6_9ZZZZ
MKNYFFEALFDINNFKNFLFFCRRKIERAGNLIGHLALINATEQFNKIKEFDLLSHLHRTTEKLLQLIAQSRQFFISFQDTVNFFNFGQEKRFALRKSFHSNATNSSDQGANVVIVAQSFFDDS